MRQLYFMSQGARMHSNNQTRWREETRRRRIPLQSAVGASPISQLLQPWPSRVVQVSRALRGRASSVSWLGRHCWTSETANWLANRALGCMRCPGNDAKPVTPVACKCRFLSYPRMQLDIAFRRTICGWFRYPSMVHQWVRHGVRGTVRPVQLSRRAPLFLHWKKH